MLTFPQILTDPSTDILLHVRRLAEHEVRRLVAVPDLRAGHRLKERVPLVRAVDQLRVGDGLDRASVGCRRLACWQERDFFVDIIIVVVYSTRKVAMRAASGRLLS